ncbi:helix-turn-helix transcriptional regulator [Rhodohalobacter sp. 614A]|uniref:helix-turn-helix transcriptional regulator n=1 Tax=Rhodohalobacter sp. 614A TaxID=2908649 RepID=UPI001F26452D|nr:AlpA family phage regulatory protein [Rhodohalobacter sp. 614A]
MKALEYSLKELIKEAVREVILEEKEKGTFDSVVHKKIQVRESEQTKIKKRDPLSIIRADELAELLSVSTVTLWRWETEGKMPAKVKFGGRMVGWRYFEIEEWLGRN